MTQPFLTYTRPDTIQGDPGTQLEEYMNDTETVPPETLRGSVDPSFNPPPAQQPGPAGTDGGGGD